MADNEGYDVVWTDRARLNLAKMEAYKVNPNQVFRKTKTILSKNPRQAAYDLLDSEDNSHPEFIGYYWTLIHNIIIIYDVFDERDKVLVDASFFANTAWAHYVFWNIEPEDWKDLEKW
ncbi:hypothetical protein [Virgibacillus sp. CBA3643]|uniref:hypothetical protein n=1 Tax=Virgibacillus sp. CBA3643 TaxID=2942278 RepID=UPI0035A3A435